MHLRKSVSLLASVRKPGLVFRPQKFIKSVQKALFFFSESAILGGSNFRNEINHWMWDFLSSFSFTKEQELPLFPLVSVSLLLKRSVHLIFTHPCTADVCIKGHSSFKNKNDTRERRVLIQHWSKFWSGVIFGTQCSNKNVSNLSGEMYKALYSFKKTHPTSLSFTENDIFLELPGASGDKNW